MIKTYNNISLEYEINPFATHQPLLIWCAENTSGNILELGAGDSSTILLNSCIQNTNKKLVTVDDSKDWLHKYNNLQSDSHKFIYINSTLEDWKYIIDYLSNDIWSLVFVDQGSSEHIWRNMRPYAVKKFINSAEYIVAHDSDLFPELKNNNYYYHEYIPTVKPEPIRNGPSSYLISAKNKLDNFKLSL